MKPIILYPVILFTGVFKSRTMSILIYFLPEDRKLPTSEKDFVFEFRIQIQV